MFKIKNSKILQKTPNTELALVSVSFFIFFLIIYHGLFLEYGFTDDYEFLLNASNDNFINVFVQGGRFIYGFLVKAAFISINGVAQLCLLRVLGLVGAVIFIIIVYDYLRKINYSKIHSVFICLLLACSPSISIKIGWSLAFIFPFLLSLSFVYGIYITKLSSWKALLLFPFGVLVLFCYQPIYTFSIVPLVLLWLKKNTHPLKVAKVLFIHLSTYFIYYFLFKYSLNLFELNPLSRSSVDLDLLNKFEWFVSEPLVKALKYNFIFTDKAISWIILSIVSISIIVHIYFRKPKKIIVNILIVCVFILLSYLPNLVASDPWVSYRTMDTLVFILVLIGSSNLFLFSFKKENYLVYSIAIIISLSAYYNFNYGLSYIQSKEYNALKMELKRESNKAGKLIFIQPEVKFLSENGFMNKTVTDEFGRMSSSSDWVPEPMIKLICNDLNITHPEVIVKDKIPNNSNLNGMRMINMKALYLKD